MNEIWKEINGYEGMYEVSNLGRVRSLDRKDSKNRYVRGRIIKLGVATNGYMQAHLWTNNEQKVYLVHRLVAQAFIENASNLPEINHKDENPKNNKTDNLEWCTSKYNSNYGTHVKRISEARRKPVLQYDKNGNLIKKFPSVRSTDDDGFYHTSVSAACKGMLKQHKGYIWKYA